MAGCERYGLPFWLWDVVYGVHPTVNQAHCKVNAYVGFVCCVTSILILWTISFNRYMSVCHHATYQRLVVTRRRALWFCVALWLGMALVSSIPFYGPGAYGYDRKIRACFVDRLNSDSVSYIFVTVPSSSFVGLLEVLVDVPAEISVSSNICFFLNSSINWLFCTAPSTSRS
nr:hypothetical protein BaRGS_008831 [Batillaria attramentaria]